LKDKGYKEKERILGYFKTNESSAGGEPQRRTPYPAKRRRIKQNTERRLS